MVPQLSLRILTFTDIWLQKSFSRNKRTPVLTSDCAIFFINWYLHLFHVHFFFSAKTDELFIFYILQVVEVTSPSVGAEFERFLNVFHLLIMSFTCQTVAGLEVIAAKVKSIIFIRIIFHKYRSRPCFYHFRLLFPCYGMQILYLLIERFTKQE